MIPLPQPVYVVCNANGEFVGLYSTNEVAQRVAAYEGATVSECREVWEEVPPEVLEATKTFHITVNSQAVTTDKHELDYWDVVRLSHFGEEAVQKKRILTVVFSRGPVIKPEGCLWPGGPIIMVREGMRFSVADTSNA